MTATSHLPGRKSPSPQKDRHQARIKTVENALRALVRDAYSETFGHLAPNQPFDLDLKLKVDPANNWDIQFDPSLIEQFLPQMEHLEADHGVFREGSIYCFQCLSSECQHARPNSSLEVFNGYNQQGCPDWVELTQHLIDHQDERIDQLFGNRPRVLTRFSRGRDLKSRQLASFGRSSKTYSLLAQVVSGYIPWRDPVHAPQGERLAITFQAVELRDTKGHIALALNPIYYLPEGVEIIEVIDERFEWLPEATRDARQALKQIEQKAAKQRGPSRGETMGKIPDILRKLASELEKGQRRGERRTRHARDRRHLRRPIDTAMADLRQARLDHIYRDLKTKALVLVGGKGRCHVFNDDGRHVTSFTIPSGSVQQRVRKQRWAPIDKDGYHRFMENFGTLAEPAAAWD